jgi:hypothetical protein
MSSPATPPTPCVRRPDYWTGVLEEPRERWLWVRWSLPWDFDQPGTYTILCRASDEVGRAQPHEPRRNWLRKNFNGIVPVTITIAG